MFEVYLSNRIKIEKEIALLNDKLARKGLDILSIK